MKAVYSIFFASALLFSCKEDVKKTYIPDQSSSLEIVLHDQQDQEIALNDTTELSTGYNFELKLFKLHISDIILIEESGEEVLIKDVDLLSLGDAEKNAAAFKIPAATYTSMRIGFGLNADQNQGDPSSYAPEHPLSNYQNMYWPMINYRFAKLEGTARNITTDSTYLVSIHPGTDPLYQLRTYEFENALKVDDTHHPKFQLSLDFNAIFDGPAGVLDFSKEGANQVHSIESGPAKDIHLAERFMKNLADATKLTSLSQ